MFRRIAEFFKKLFSPTKVQPFPLPEPTAPTISPEPIRVPPTAVMGQWARYHWDRWQGLVVNPQHRKIVNDMTDRIISHKARYQGVERTTGVPWYVIGCMHMREAWPPFSFGTHLANGEPLSRKTTLVPKGIGPFATWEEGAEAILRIKKYDQLGEWHLANVLERLEIWNGTGYRRRGHETPYLYSMTNRYVRGKFVADGRYDASAVDKQVGCAAVLLTLRDRGVDLDERAPRA